MPGEREIVLGPSFELHPGTHGALLRYPPPGVRYVQRPSSCCCVFDRSDGPPSPFVHLSLCDSALFELPDGPVPVHASHLPVENDVPWLADPDCLLSTLHYGQFFAAGSYDRISAGLVDRDAIRARQRAMLARYVDERCVAIAFMTALGRDSALEYIADAELLSAPELERLSAKSDVIHPALPYRGGPARTDGPVTILYSGRNFAVKGGAIALAAFARLRERFPGGVQLVFAGELPPPADRPPGIVFAPELPADDFESILRRCDVFFLPTLCDSYGMTQVEAASYGAAIVTSCGAGNEHIGELFADGLNAYLVPNELPPDRRVEQYVDAIARLVEDRAARLAMRDANRELIERGKLSIAARDRRLLPHYERMWEQLERLPSRLAPRPAWPRGVVRKRFSEPYLWLEIARSRHTHVQLPMLG